MPPDKSAAVIETHTRQYPLARLRRRPSGQYNCHGLTLANRRSWSRCSATMGIEKFASGKWSRATLLSTMTGAR